MIYKKYLLYTMLALSFQVSNIFGMIFGPGGLQQEVRAYELARTKADKEEAKTILDRILAKIMAKGTLIARSKPLRNFLSRHKLYGGDVNVNTLPDVMKNLNTGINGQKTLLTPYVPPVAPANTDPRIAKNRTIVTNLAKAGAPAKAGGKAVAAILNATNKITVNEALDKISALPAASITKDQKSAIDDIFTAIAGLAVLNPKAGPIGAIKSTLLNDITVAAKKLPDVPAGFVPGAPSTGTGGTGGGTGTAPATGTGTAPATGTSTAPATGTGTAPATDTGGGAGTGAGGGGGKPKPPPKVWIKKTLEELKAAAKPKIDLLKANAALLKLPADNYIKQLLDKLDDALAKGDEDKVNAIEGMIFQINRYANGETVDAEKKLKALVMRSPI